MTRDARGAPAAYVSRANDARTTRERRAITAAIDVAHSRGGRMDVTVQSEETLADVLGERARRSTADRLVVTVARGVVVAAAAIVARPPEWPLLLSAAACIACYGCWAIAMQRTDAYDESGRSSPRRPWIVARYVAATVGVLALGALLFSFLDVALGKLIS